METEVQNYITELGILKEQIQEAVKGLNDEATNWCPLSEETNSIYAILYHLMGSEEYWIRQIVGGESVDRDREAEFHASGHLSEILERWEDLSRISNNILGNLSSSQLEESRIPTIPTTMVSHTVRGCILHVISHYATHLGHIELTRQLWEQR